MAEVRAGWKRRGAAVEAVHGDRWEEFRDRDGDWGREVALYRGRRLGWLRLQALARKSGGVDYTAVGQAIGRVQRNLQRHPCFGTGSTTSRHKCQQ